MSIALDPAKKVMTPVTDRGPRHLEAAVAEAVRTVRAGGSDFTIDAPTDGTSKEAFRQAVLSALAGESVLPLDGLTKFNDAGDQLRIAVMRFR